MSTGKIKSPKNKYKVSHFKVSVNSHHGHECDAGRAVGKHQEEVYSAYAIPEHPVSPDQGIDPQRQADQSQEVCDDQVEEEQVVWVPGLQLEAEDPQGHDISQYSQYDVYSEDRGQDQTLQLDANRRTRATCRCRGCRLPTGSSVVNVF